MPDFFAFENNIICGCDEAGRGCLAGPVVAAAVILPDNLYHPLLNDSKQVKKTDREILRDFIVNNALDFGVGIVSHQEIDEINILKASILAMHRAIDGLKMRPEILIIDGNKFYPYRRIPHQCIIKGDSKYTQISAASILAKTYRDDMMVKLSKEYAEYQWDINKGYPTKSHRAAIQKYGITPYHRRSFRLFKENDSDLILFEK
ncbi:MAG: ribonuclease HII [Chitinophagales bacterium]|nr:ribonuclease HII [Chitinophagales bacterium]